MQNTKISFGFLLIVMLNITSCKTTYNMGSIQIEIMRPASIALPEGVDTIAILKRDFYQSDTITFRYIKYVKADNHIVKTDTSIHYSYLSNKCVDALANILETEGYFLKVINYRDSMNYLFTKADSLTNYPKLHEKFGADAFVLLDDFKFRDRFAEKESGFTYFMSYIKYKFPEFQESTKVESIDADLLWTITFKGDTSIYVIKQPDNLYYGNSVYPDLFGNDFNHKLLLTNTAEYLGKSFAKNIISSWHEVNRTYYKSSDDNMLLGEKYLLDNDWIKAAEIYNRETNNKNKNIAAKATFNMALICEMEGNLDAAFDWLDRSKSTYKLEDPIHKFNCEQYFTELTTRKKEIELLDKQIKTNAEN